MILTHLSKQRCLSAGRARPGCNKSLDDVERVQRWRFSTERQIDGTVFIPAPAPFVLRCIGPGIKKDIDRLQVAVTCSNKQGGHSLGIRGLDVGAQIQQQRNLVIFSMRNTTVQRPVTETVLSIDVLTAFNEPANHFVRARGEMQHRTPRIISRPSTDLIPGKCGRYLLQVAAR